MVDHPVQVYLRHFMAAQQCLWRDLSFDLGSLGKTFAFSCEPKPPNASKTPKGVMLFAHGTGNDSVFPHLQLFGDLLRLGWIVCAFDLPGHGFSSTTSLDGSTAVLVVREALKRIAVHYPGLPIQAVGYSLGGVLLAKALQEIQARGAIPYPVTGVAYIATPYSLGHLGLKVVWGELAAVCQKEFYRQKIFYGLLGTIPPLGNLRRKHFPIRLPLTSSPPSHYPKAVRALIKSLEVEDAVKDSIIPTLFVYGARDYLVPLSQGQRLAQLSQKGTLVVVPRLTHYTLLFDPNLGNILDEYADEHRV